MTSLHINKTSSQKKYYIIGWPAYYSLSPIIHNGWFNDWNLKNHHYDILPISPDENFEKRLDLLHEESSFYGANVTVPYKKKAFDYVKKNGSLSLKSLREGAVNTLINIPYKNALKGHTTDGLGFIKAFKTNMMEAKHKNVSKNRGIILGAGGASRSIAKNLADENIDFCVVNRTPINAQKMLDDINVKVPVYSMESCDKAMYGAHFFINASSWGMKNPKQQEIIQMKKYLHALDPSALVMDLLYWPYPTPLVVLAQEANLLAKDGCLMLVWQAWYAFREWTGLEASASKALERVEIHRSCLSS